MEESGFYLYNSTNESGVVVGRVPINSILYLKFNSASCVTNQSVTTIGPLTADTETTIIVNLGLTSTQLYGTLLNCNNSRVASGYVMLFQNSLGATIIPVVEGNFSYNMTYCNPSFSLRGYDSETNNISQLFNSTFSSDTTNVGNLIACTTLNCSYNLEGSYTLVVTRNDTGQVYTFPNEIIRMITPEQYKTTTTGNYSIANLDPSVTDAGFYFNVNNCQDLRVPSQNFAAIYTNIVRGNPSNNAIDGQVLSTAVFQLNYEIVFATGVRTYTAVYTRN